MKKINSIIAIVALSIAFSTSVTAQTTDSATATAAASATIIAPITIGAPTEMSFGRIIATALGTVEITPAGLRSASTSGVTLPSGDVNKGTWAAATFAVTGQAGYAYAVTLPSDIAVVLTNTTGATMAVTGFNSKTANSEAIDNTGLLTGGSDVVSVGAILHVAAGQAAGVYTTDDTPISVTVAYN